MSLIQEIRSYRPWNEQEERDQKQMLRYMEHNANYLERSDEVAHFSASIWTLNREHTKTLMVYHNIYDSWSWIGGHADGDEDLCRVAHSGAYGGDRSCKCFSAEQGDSQPGNTDCERTRKAGSLCAQPSAF